MPGGRPVKYTDEFIENEAVALLEYLKTEEIPFLKHFCSTRGYGSQNIAEFNKNKKFSEALNIFKDTQEAIIARGGLKEKFNPHMSFNTLKNVAGWRDKHDIEHSGDMDLNINVNIKTKKA